MQWLYKSSAPEGFGLHAIAAQLLCHRIHCGRVAAYTKRGRLAMGLDRIVKLPEERIWLT